MWLHTNYDILSLRKMLKLHLKMIKSEIPYNYFLIISIQTYLMSFKHSNKFKNIKLVFTQIFTRLTNKIINFKSI